MKRNNHAIEQYRIQGPVGCNLGAFVVWGPVCRALAIVASDGGGWDHVSVHIIRKPKQTPTWAEMCAVKDLFWDPEEAVMQLHPPRSTWVNEHAGCLHLWRPQSDQEIERIRQEWGKEWPREWDQLKSPGIIPLPPAEFVGAK